VAKQRRAARGAQSRIASDCGAREPIIYAALPAITGKTRTRIRRRDLRGAENIARELVRSAVGRVFHEAYCAGANFQSLSCSGLKAAAN
jgi:hypothetical protein